MAQQSLFTLLLSYVNMRQSSDFRLIRIYFRILSSIDYNHDSVGYHRYTWREKFSPSLQYGANVIGNETYLSVFYEWALLTE